jgi:hypothetical protein
VCLYASFVELKFLASPVSSLHLLPRIMWTMKIPTQRHGDTLGNLVWLLWASKAILQYQQALRTAVVTIIISRRLIQVLITMLWHQKHLISQSWKWLLIWHVRCWGARQLLHYRKVRRSVPPRNIAPFP